MRVRVRTWAHPPAGILAVHEVGEHVRAVVELELPARARVSKRAGQREVGGQAETSEQNPPTHCYSMQ